MRYSRIIIGVLLVYLFVGVLGHGDHKASRVLSSFSFKPPFFPEAGLSAVPGWETRGSTQISSDKIALTHAKSGISGILVNKRPFFLKTVELTLEFKIHSTESRGGDGLVLWLADQPARPGPNFGGPDKWNGIAVVIDNFSNDGLSTISLHFNDGTRRYDFDTDGDSTRLGTCRYKLRNVKDLSALHLYIENDKVNILIDENNDGNWSRCMPATQVLMPSRYFFSISASTGIANDIHEVTRLYVNTMDEKLSLGNDEDANKPSQEQKDSLTKPYIEPKVEDKTVEEKIVEDKTVEEKKEIKDEEPIPLTAVEKDIIVNEAIEKMVLELRAEIAELEDEKNAQTLAANEAKRLLKIYNDEQAQRDRDWEEKEKQLQNANRIAQNLVSERETEKNHELASYANCDELGAECINLADYYGRLVDSLNQARESFGHELVEIQYLFGDKLRYITSLMAPIDKTAIQIKADIVQALSQIKQLSGTVEQITGYSNSRKVPAGAEARRFSDLQESLNTLQKNLVQSQTEQKQLTQKLNILKERIKVIKPSGLTEILLVFVMFLIIAIQIVQFCLARKQTRRRGGMLY